MTGIELEALRRLLFFSPPEAAMLVANVSEQAWRRWEAGTRSVPGDVSAKLIQLSDWRLSAIDGAVRQVGSMPVDAKISLVWYRSIDDWSTLPGREPALWRPQQSACAALMAEFSGRMRLVEFSGSRYSAWLGQRADGEDMRAYWANEEI